MLLIDATMDSLAALRKRPAYYAALFATEVFLLAILAGGSRSNSAGFSSGVSVWTYLPISHPHRPLPSTGCMANRPRLRRAGHSGRLAKSGLRRRPSWFFIAATLVAWLLSPALAFLGTCFLHHPGTDQFRSPSRLKVGAERRMHLPLIAVLAAVILAARCSCCNG